jgi:capsular polysaccharide biosynthesis protein
MEFAEIVRILWARKLATLAVVVTAVVVAVAVRMSVHSVPTGAATVQILVDSPDSALANLSQETVPLTTRASVFAQVMTSAAVLEDIASSAGVQVNQITAQGPYSGSGESLDVVTPSEARSNQLLAEQKKFKLTFVAQTNEPVVTASVQAPNADAAARMAAAIYPGVQHYVTELQQQSGTPVEHRVTIRQLGPPQAGSVNSSARATLTMAALLGVLILGLLGILGFEGMRRRAATHAREPEVAHEYMPEFDDVALYTRSLAAEEPDLPMSVSGPPARRR